MQAYVYIQSEPQLWTVGFWRDMGQGEPSRFEAESDHPDPEIAAARVRYLNGGGGLEAAPPGLYRDPVAVGFASCPDSPRATPYVLCDDGSFWVGIWEDPTVVPGTIEEWQEDQPIPGSKRANELAIASVAPDPDAPYAGGEI